MTDTTQNLPAPATTPPAAPPPAPTPAAPDLPLSFETALQRMLRENGDGRDPSLSAIAGAALLLLQNAEQSLATIAGASTDKAKTGVVTLPLDADGQDRLVDG